MPGMNIGEVVAMHSCNVIKGSTTFGYKAHKGKRMVFIFLGVEPRDGPENMDVDKVLEGMGWKYESQ